MNFVQKIHYCPYNKGIIGDFLLVYVANLYLFTNFAAKVFRFLL